MEAYFDILDNKNVVELCRFRSANHKLPMELEDGITIIELTEFARTVIKMNSVMNFTIFQIAHYLNKIEISIYQSTTTVGQMF